MAAVVAPGTPAPAETQTVEPVEQATGAAVVETSEAPEEKEGPRPGSREWLAKMAEGRKKAREAKAKAKAEGKPELIDPEAEQAEPEKPKALDDISATLFTPEALATPEGVKRAGDIVLFAKEDLERRHRKLDGFDIRQKEKKRNQEARDAEFTARERKIADIGGRIMRGLQIIRGERLSNPMQICMTLDELAGGPGDANAGRELAEQIMIAMARDGKEVKESRSEKVLRERLENFERERLAERQAWEEQTRQAETQQYAQGVKQLELQIGSHAASNPAQFPAIGARIAGGRVTAADVGEYAADLMEQAVSAGGQLDMREALGILESRLAPLGAGQAAKAENGGGRQQSTASQPRTKSGAKQSTVLPSDADRSLGGSSKLSPDERRARNSRDPSMWKRLGPAFENAARGD